MLQLPEGLPAELAPMAWLIGVWEGTGVLNYPVGDEVRSYEFGHRASFSHDGLPHLNYSSYTWKINTDDDQSFPEPLMTETGYWRLSRPATDADPGPGLLAGVGDPAFANAEAVETLRNSDGGFDLEVSLLHPGGVSELYLGHTKDARIDLATDAVMRSTNAKTHTASTRMYGLVEGDLLWAWDIAALGRTLTSHASGRLSRVD
ncbi:MAG: FABP family protein [Microbacteriaceae bacterium]|nr:FABP family protein [Microbacteriaceae bacterium]